MVIAVGACVNGGSHNKSDRNPCPATQEEAGLFRDFAALSLREALV
jgi:hypothetical protein